MSLETLEQKITDLLVQSGAFENIPIITGVTADHNARMAQALEETGLCLVVMTSSGQASGKPPRLILDNALVVSVLENPIKNQSGNPALWWVEKVLSTVHQADWPTQRGIQNKITVDTPAYEMGPLETGLILYFCNFRIITTHE